MNSTYTAKKALLKTSKMHLNLVKVFQNQANKSANGVSKTDLVRILESSVNI